MADLKRRDKKDSTRVHSPLQKAGDAIEIDTSMLSIDQQVEKVEKFINLVREKNNK
jgi:cytidylate kinase